MKDQALGAFFLTVLEKLTVDTVDNHQLPILSILPATLDDLETTLDPMILQRPDHHTVGLGITDIRVRKDRHGGFHSYGPTQNRGFLRENPIYKWMMNGVPL